MTPADPFSWRKPRFGVLALVALIHVAAVVALIRAFAPGLAEGMTRGVVAAFTVTVTTPPPRPEAPAPQPERAPERPGAAGAEGRKSTPRAAIAPVVRIILPRPPAPPVAGSGTAIVSGARDQGSGSGAGGSGSGTGAGTQGGGQGSGGTGAKAVKIAGEISAARDYSPLGRELRQGDYVIVALTIGTDGRVKACRVHRPSRDPQADQTTCRLAAERFRFRPATDAAGDPVQSSYGWQQRWFDPREKKKR